MRYEKLKVPEECNYVACFLTLRCNKNCSYCINSFGSLTDSFNEIHDSELWIEYLNRFELRDDLPITIQGGEPGLHPSFIDIINGVRKEIKLDILTNLSFDIEDFIERVSPGRLERVAPYAPVRVSYHPENTDLESLLKKVERLTRAGFYIGVYSVLHPKYLSEVESAKKEALSRGIDFRTKEFLGWYEGRLYGTYLYEEAVTGISGRQCLCRTSEILIDPEAKLHRCHHFLYSRLEARAQLSDKDINMAFRHLPCSEYGLCNPCDIKVKTNRFQEFGHTSVDIKEIEV